jgi:hypothetical protein
MGMTRNTWMMIAALTTCTMAAEPWSAVEKDGRLEGKYGGSVVLGWQATPLGKPVGGDKFASSAFLHPLCTPAGFACTTIQPSDHLHHLGLWWPWKFIEVDGVKYNTWEIQEGQGAHVAKSTKLLTDGPDKLEWELVNETVIKKPGAAPEPVILETTRLAITSDGGGAHVLDVSLKQKALGKPVAITAYRYSGFSWRGPASWNKSNSTMTTSEGKGRDDANGKPARWVVVSGQTPNGSASVLLMSAADTSEKLRVWDSNAHDGAPFVNFNPVMGQSLQLDDAHPAVSNRKYRVIATDRVIDAAAAETAWRKWMAK